MKELIHQPHDKLFKAAFGQKEVAKDFLKNRLPPKILAKVDLETLTLCSSSYVSEELKSRQSDIVYKARTTNQEEVFFYFLLEQQTREDPLQPLRVLEYNIFLAKDHFKEHKSKKIPYIINIVLYTGKKKYKGAKSLKDAFVSEEAFRSMFYNNFLIELNAEDEEKISKDEKAALVEFVLREGEWRDYCNYLAKKNPIVILLPSSPYCKETVVYILDRDRHSPEKVIKALHLPEDKQKEIMTALQQLEYRGIRKGRQEGIREGMEKIKRMARRLLADGYSIEEVADMASLSEEQVRRIQLTK